MKKSLLALVVLGAFAGAASAQSSVVIFGKIDQAVGKPIGTDNKQVMDTAGSRIAFRGAEDLGGGLYAIFGFEHRFVPDAGLSGNGNGATPNLFWDGFSWVGVRSATLGTLTIGRQYTAAFLNVQNQVDPFAGETVGSLRSIWTGTSYGSGFNPPDVPNVWMGGATARGIVRTRTPNSLKYENVFGGFRVAADYAEAAAAGADRPYSVALSYAGGPFWAGIAYENPEGQNDRLINIGARYKIGAATLAAGFSDGRLNAPAANAAVGAPALAVTTNKLRAYIIGATINVGAGDIKAGFATSKVGGYTTNSRFAVGYHHNLSKRTKLYADIARESKLVTGGQRNGYDLGVQHQF